MHLVGNNSPIGFYAVASAVESIKKLSKYQYHAFGEGGNWFPCLQLVNVAVHHRFQRRDLGKVLVGSVIALFAEVGPQIGLPHLILKPISEAVMPFYESLGFNSYDAGERMFLPLQVALDAVASEKPIREAALIDYDNGDRDC